MAILDPLGATLTASRGEAIRCRRTVTNGACISRIRTLIQPRAPRLGFFHRRRRFVGFVPDWNTYFGALLEGRGGWLGWGWWDPSSDRHGPGFH